MGEKYYTQRYVSELLGLSTVTVYKYISELSNEEKKGKFNSQNRPNEEGIELLKSIKKEKLGDDVVENSDNLVIENLNHEIEELKKDLLLKDKKILELTEEKAKMASDYADKFSNFLNQQQILQGQLSSVIDFQKKLESAQNPQGEKKGFFARLLGK